MQNGDPVNISPGILAMYATLAWLTLSLPIGALIGRAICTADRVTCYCGTCAR